MSFVRVGSNCDLQRPLKYRRFSTRNETFGAECRQSAGKRTLRRSEAKVRLVPEADTPHLRSSSEQRDCVRRSRAYPGRCELSEKVEIPAEDEIEPPRAPAARQVPDERRRRLAVAPHDFEGVTARILDDLPSESGGLRGRTRRRFVRLRDDRYSRIAWQRFRPWPVLRLLSLACASVPI